jgi:hypothetical protein
MGIQVNLSLPEIYKALCPKCKKALQELVKSKMADQAIQQALEGKEEE